MCGRFTLTTRYTDITSSLQLEFDPQQAAQFRPRYNIAPTSPHWIVARGPAQARYTIVPARWGFPAPFGPGQDDPVGHINARAETAAGKPTFRAAFLRGRCCVLADGFFEWSGPKGARQPYWFHRRDRGPMLFAGLYRDIDHGGETIRRFTILTCGANKVVSPYHRRMPAILSRGDLASWLDPVAPEGRAAADKEEREAIRASLSALLTPAPDDWLVATAVSNRVNSVRNDDPGCIEPMATQSQLSYT